jgi:DNA (cytosine-5)-methyltransferase 1
MNPPGSPTFGSLFSGIGGLDLGLERAGMMCRWQVEIDEFATRVLERHWPDVARFRDVRECGAHNLGRVDLIAGGFPCQDISPNGNRSERLGLDGARSGLWAEFARIVRDLRPRYVLVENVSALSCRGLGRVLGDLAAIGFDAEWECFPAAAFGAPHFRDRTFIVAYPDDNSGPQSDGKSIQSRIFTSRWDYLGGLDLAERRAASAPAIFRGMDDGLPDRMDRLTGLGNAVVPQVAEWIGKRLMETMT